MSMPKSYRTIEEFQREELRPGFKAGFSLDDLMQETHAPRERPALRRSARRVRGATTTKTTRTDPRSAALRPSRRRSFFFAS